VKAFLASALLATGLAASAFGQVTSSDIAALKFWPNGPIKYLATKHFDYAGDYGYYLDPNPSTSLALPYSSWANWRAVIYTGLTGKRVYAYGDWGNPDPGPPVWDPVRMIWRDNCQHTHVAYGVWLYYSYYSGGQYYSGWVGGIPVGGKSGVRVNNYTCSHAIKNPLSPNGDNVFGWGQDYFTFDFPKTGNIWTTMAVGVTAVSHAMLGCGQQGCTNSPWIIAYTVAY